jgi:hypothetical protein
VTASGDRAYVAGYQFGVQVLDITYPSTPTLVTSYTSPFEGAGLAVTGHQLFMAAESAGLRVAALMQDLFETGDNIGQSLPVDDADNFIARARLTTTQTDDILWEVSADSINWSTAAPDSRASLSPGNDLRWRATLSLAPSWPIVGPIVSQLDLEWQNAEAVIDSIVDVPDDQGGAVRVHLSRSGYDFSDEVAYPLATYFIWRRIDDPVVASMSLSTNKTALPALLSKLTFPTVEQDGRIFLDSAAAAASVFPPGTWEVVQNVPGLQQEHYIAFIPTITDADPPDIPWETYVVTAHTTTPSVWFISLPDSGYSIDNIAPPVPTNFTAAYNTGSGNQLSWDPSPDDDLEYFRVYRDTDPDFVPSPANRVGETASTDWTDLDYDGGAVYYKITAVDDVENESDPASPGTTTAVAKPAIPTTYALHQNHPNPFNPTTTIRYDVPVGGGNVTLRIYDVNGRLVRTLVEGRRPAGQLAVTWDGRDNKGNPVATGAYFYRVRAKRFEQTRKMVLLK